MRGGRAPQAEEAASAGTASLPCLIHLGLPDHHFLPPHLGQQARVGIYTWVLYPGRASIVCTFLSTPLGPPEQLCWGIMLVEGHATDTMTPGLGFLLCRKAQEARRAFSS